MLYTTSTTRIMQRVGLSLPRILRQPQVTGTARRPTGLRFMSTPPSKSAVEVVPPTSRQLRIVAIRAGIPMIGFGFMDNLVMIQAGDAIDANLGTVLAISTMTAAGFGQCFSDVAGITCGGFVDSAVAKLNLPRHMLSPDQLDLRVSRIYTTIGGCIGVVTGCLLGMSCLLFMDTDKREREKRARELQSIFETIMQEGDKLVDADRVTLFMLDREKGELWSQVATGGTRGVIKVDRHSGIVGVAVDTKKLINIPDAYADSRFNQAVDDRSGYKTHSMLVMPFKDHEGEVLGAIQMINKKKSDGTIIPFDSNDEKLLTMLASHVTAFINIVNGD